MDIKKIKEKIRKILALSELSNVNDIRENKGCPLSLCEGDGKIWNNADSTSGQFFDCECGIESDLPKPRFKKAMDKVFGIGK